MITIKKFVFSIDDTIINLPKESLVIKIAPQYDRLWLWALVDTQNEKQQFEIACYGDGSDMYTLSTTVRYVDSVINGDYVWHIFLDKQLNVVSK